MRKLTVKEMCVCALFAALMCIFGPITIPIGPIPVSLLNFMICLCACVLGWRGCTISTAVYLLLGLVGLPVFSGGTGGLAKLAGPTGGFLIGYLFVAIIGGFGAEYFRRRTAGMRRPVFTGLSLILATAVLYLFGTVWFVIEAQAAFAYALSVCVLPFVLLDLAKIIVAVLLGDIIYKALVKAGVR